jgi:surfeit locus 1 family protein
MSLSMTRRSRLTFLAFALLAGLICARLGFWQLSRLRERRASNARILASRELPSIDLDQGASDSVAINRIVRVSGSYDFSTEFVIRRQSMEGVPAVRIVTPLHPATGDTAVLVIRGIVPSPDANSVELDSLREPGPQRVEGIAIAITMDARGGEPLNANGRTTWARLDLAAIRKALPYPVRGIAILQRPDSSLPNFPRRIEPAPLDDGPHLSYAVQWFGFAITALVGGVIVTRKRTEAEGNPGTTPSNNEAASVD